MTAAFSHSVTTLQPNHKLRLHRPWQMLRTLYSPTCIAGLQYCRYLNCVSVIQGTRRALHRVCATQVVLCGQSYDATAALFTASMHHPVVKGVVALYPFWYVPSCVAGTVEGSVSPMQLRSSQTASICTKAGCHINVVVNNICRICW